MGRLADLDAVTLDANGTLLGLLDPVPELDRILRDHGIERQRDAIRQAFETEGTVYANRAAEAHAPVAFATMQRECAGVFLDEVGAALDPTEFTSAYVGAMQFEVLPGVADALRFLRGCGLQLAVVANFDLTLADRLGDLGLRPWFSTVVTPGDAGVAKPDPAIFEFALTQLGVSAERTLHIGDGRTDEEGARAAGMHFAWAPIQSALAAWR